MATYEVGPDLTVERYAASDPGTAFGAIPTDSIGPRGTDSLAGGREYFADDAPAPRPGDDTGAGSYFAGEPDGGSVGDDGYERDAAGTVKLNKDGSKRRKRGRKHGSTVGGTSGSPRRESASVLDGKQIANVLLLGFNTTAAVFKAPEWSLEEDEANEAGKAIQRASRHYDVPVTSKQVDTMMAVYALMMLLGPRAYLSIERLKTEKASKSPRVNPRPPAVVDPRPVVPQPTAVPPHGPREAQPGPGAGFPSFMSDPK